MIAKKEATDLNHDDDTSSRANVEIYRNFRPISLCDSKSPQATHQEHHSLYQTLIWMYKTTIRVTKWTWGGPHRAFTAREMTALNLGIAAKSHSNE